MIVNVFFLTFQWMITVFFSKSKPSKTVIIDKVSEFFNCHIFIALTIASLYITIHREKMVLRRLTNCIEIMETISNLK